jgi:hypothetical protein
MYGDKVQIRDINGQIEVDERLEDVYDNNIYTIIDKQSLGESIGRELLDEDPEEDYIDNCHLIYEEIDKTINGIVNDIFGYVEEYLDNNQ